MEGKLVFRLVDIDTRSNETTMNRTPVSFATGSATATTYGNTTTARGSAFSIRGQEGRNEVLPPNATEFAIDPAKRRELRIGSVMVNVIEFDETALRYSLSLEPRD